jgi:flagellar basal-body rod protein FlgG
MKALQIAATGMLAQQTRVSVISNNIANVDTTAYNARRAEFADLLYQQEKRAGAVSSDAGTVLPAGVQIGLGVRTAAISMDNTRGSLRQTDGDLDLAIEGRGYFEVALPDGTAAYTRDGSF